MKKLLFEILQLVYPKLCVGCTNKLLSAENILCLRCYKDLALTGNYYPYNATERLLLGRTNIKAASSLLYYKKDGITQNLLYGLKYNGQTNIGEMLGQMMAKHIQEANWPLQNAVLLPVPLAPKRLQRRGYNQSMVIAEAMAEVLDIPISNNMVYRTKNTETQTKKSRLQRYQNMQSAFDILDADYFENKNVIVVDDVITTGATLEACLLAFKQVPNVHVSVLCAAIADT